MDSLKRDVNKGCCKPLWHTHIQCMFVWRTRRLFQKVYN